MAWVLLNLVEMPLTVGSWDDAGNYVTQTSNVPAGTVMNVIVYDGSSHYVPPPSLFLKEVNDPVKVGDFIGL